MSQPNGRGLSFSDRDTRLPPESSPAAVFNRLFGPQFGPGDEPIIDPSRWESVLDVVLDDVRRLRQARRDDKRWWLSTERRTRPRVACPSPGKPTWPRERPQTMTDAPDLEGRPQMGHRAGRGGPSGHGYAYLTRVASLCTAIHFGDVSIRVHRLVTTSSPT